MPFALRRLVDKDEAALELADVPFLQELDRGFWQKRSQSGIHEHRLGFPRSPQRVFIDRKEAIGRHRQIGLSRGKRIEVDFADADSQAHPPRDL
jgi:hypothetical protein